MSQNGLVVLAVPSRMTFDDWAARVKNVATIKKKLYFYIGDLVLYGEATFGEKASQMLNDFGYNEKQLAQFRWVAKKFAAEDRCDLPWSWHQAAAALPKRERDKALTAALAGEMNRAGIRALVHANGNGASNGSDGSGRTGGSGNGIPSELEAGLDALGMALVGAGKLVARRMKGEAVDSLLRAAMDEVGAEWQKLTGRLAG